MTHLIAMYLVLWSIALGACVVIPVLRGRAELFTVRNFFLLGVIYFQSMSAAAALWSGEYGHFTPSEPSYAGLIFSVLLTVFVGAILFFYRRGWIVRWMARHTPMSFAPANPATMLTLAFSFLVLGVFMRVVLGQIPLAGIVFFNVSTGVLAVAAGMAVWAWAPRLWNPAVAVPAIPIVLGSVLAGTYGTFGRREILNIVLACVWAAVHSWWKHLGLMRAAMRIGVIAFLGLALLAGFTATRGDAGERRTPAQVLADLQGAQIGKGLQAIFSAQDTGPISLWVCESRPDMIPYDPFHQARFLFLHWVPRSIWPDKPLGLGLVLVDQRNVSGTDSTFTVGPGMIAHLVNDNPWLCLIPYALFLGLVLRYFDEMLAIHAHNPFLVLPLGVALGEWVGVPRGEAAIFIFLALTSTAASWMAMAFCAKVLSMLGVRLELQPHAYPDEFEATEEGDVSTDPAYPAAGAHSGPA
jgi:hypothetical protein